MNDAPTTYDTLDLARRIAALAREKRGTDMVLLDVRQLVDYTDFFLLVTGQSARQNQAIGEHVVKTLKGQKKYAISKAGLDTGSWICLDLADVVVHVFDPETRARYDLELLWADAPLIDVEPEAAPAPVSPPSAASSEVKPARKSRKRVVREAAVTDADAENAPESERPSDDAPPPPDETPLVPSGKRPRALSKAEAGLEAPPKGAKPRSSKGAGSSAPTKSAPSKSTAKRATPRSKSAGPASGAKSAPSKSARKPRKPPTS